MALSGDLSDVDIKTLLNLISQTKDTGKLTIKDDSNIINIYFKGGHPVNGDGDKTPVSSIEKALSFDKGSFEFVKMDNVHESPEAGKIMESIAKIDSIRDQWKALKSKFPHYNIMLNIAEAKGEDVHMTAEDWNILSLIRVPISLLELVKQSPYGELKTLTILSDILDKKLISITLVRDDALLPEDAIIPIKESGYFAVNAPIYGEHNMEFYKHIDNRKDFETICKEMKITFAEGREIIRYLTSQGKISV
ncbi:MAG: DUF4388 domain-containing protein, partial [Caldisericaceae bacterium]